MYKPKDQKIGPAQARWAAGPIGSIETRMAQAREWMQTNGIKTLDRRASFDDVHEARWTLGNIRLPGVIR